MAKAITIKQPWALLTVLGAKKIETRSWSTNYRGELLIHAGSKLDFNDLELVHYKPFSEYIQSQSECTLGAIIGKVELYGIESMDDKKFMRTVHKTERSFGDYSPNRFAWLFRNHVKFSTPIPVKGKLSIWEYNDLLIKQTI